MAPRPPLSGDMRLAFDRMKDAVLEAGGSRAATNAMANLAEAIQGLVQHMRTEQQMIRDWVDSQAEQHKRDSPPARTLSCVEKEL